MCRKSLLHVPVLASPVCFPTPARPPTCWTFNSVLGANTLQWSEDHGLLHMQGPTWDWLEYPQVAGPKPADQCLGSSAQNYALSWKPCPVPEPGLIPEARPILRSPAYS